MKFLIGQVVEPAARVAEKAIESASSGEILISVLVLLIVAGGFAVYIWKIAGPQQKSLENAVNAMRVGMDQQERIRSLEELQSTLLLDTLKDNQSLLQKVSLEMHNNTEALKNLEKVNERLLQRISD